MRSTSEVTKSWDKRLHFSFESTIALLRTKLDSWTRNRPKYYQRYNFILHTFATWEGDIKKFLYHLRVSPVSISSNWTIIASGNFVYLGNSTYSKETTNQTFLRITWSRTGQTGEGEGRLLAMNKWLMCLLVYISSNVVGNLSTKDVTPGTSGWVYVFQFKMHVRMILIQNLRHF